MKKRVILLGSTGSIGRNAMEVIRASSGLEVVALSTHNRIDVLEEQLRGLNAPVAVCTGNPEWTQADCRVYSGPEGLCAMVRDTEADIVLAAITGIAGLPPILAGIETGKDIALANKEALVVAGDIVTTMAREKNVRILPVDSEHSAIFQCLQSGRPEEIKSITLTASGGPFLETPLESFARITAEQAVAHPTWDMGKKISVDSATMMNKALEIIEARFLFDLAPAAIRVMIHPQSIVHSLVEFIDHSVIAQMGVPDMKIPIQYALTYPTREAGPAPRLDLAACATLTFSEVDPQRFPAITLGYEVARRGGTMGAVFNGANESAVDRFLKNEIAFPQIIEIVRQVMEAHQPIANPDLNEVLEADRWAREQVQSQLTAAGR